MAGKDNLTPFGPDNVVKSPGRPKGSKNRSTVLKELYQMVVSGDDLKGVKRDMPIEVAIMTALVKKGLTGDIPAIKEAQDTVYGKVPDKISETDPDGNHAPRTVTINIHPVAARQIEDD